MTNVYTIEYQHGNGSLRTWHKLGWQYLYTSRATAEYVIAARSKRYPNVTYRVVSLEVKA